MKKVTCAVLVTAALLLAVPMSGYAGGPRVSFGVGIGVGYPGFGIGVGYPAHWGHHHGWWGPRFYWGGPIVVAPDPYPYPYYDVSPPAAVEPQPPAYAQPAQPQEDYWYYCQNPQGYYPYVKSCPGGWMKVVPQLTPPNAPPGQ
jgi:hypothetical protein